MPDDDLHRLVGRLKHLLTDPGGGRLVILLGAGVTVSMVPGVARLTRLALEFSDQVGPPPPRADVNEPIAVNAGIQQARIARYLEAMQFIRDVRGSDGLRAFLQRAATHALDPTHRPDIAGVPLADTVYAELERATTGWQLPDGLNDLAQILRVRGGRVHKFLLTTNFDSLLEIALRRAGLRINTSYGVTGPNDSMTNLRRDRAQWMTVHLHGTTRAESLHNPSLLRQRHVEVEDWLASQLRGSHLLVLGYSGWDGLIQRTLMRHFGRDSEDKDDQGVEVLWAVFESREQHAHVDPELADFFERYNVRGVTSYYGVDRDHLLGTLQQELSRQPAATAFHRSVKQLSSEDYQFGVSRVRRDVVPAFVFWPHRLRGPHLIHGVHALAAALLSKLGIPVELHLDDTEMNPSYADRVANEFTDAVRDWFEKCRAGQMPTVHRISNLLDSMPETERGRRLWRVTTEFYSSTTSALDALVATKIATVDGDTSPPGRNITIVPKPAHRLLRPVYTWLALDDAMARNDVLLARHSTVVTLGGVDERAMWDVWRSRPAVPGVASIFLPRLESPTEGADLWQYQELGRDTPYGARDLERFLVRAAESPARSPVLKWIYIAANRLPALASDGAIEAVQGTDGKPASWLEVSEHLRRNPTEACRTLASVVEAWFLP